MKIKFKIMDNTCTENLHVRHSNITQSALFSHDAQTHGNIWSFRLVSDVIECFPGNHAVWRVIGHNNHLRNDVVTFNDKKKNLN